MDSYRKSPLLFNIPVVQQSIPALPPKLIGGVELEGVFDVADFGGSAVGFADDFDYVEANIVRLKFVLFEVANSGAGEAFSLFFVHSRKRATVVFIFAGFNFNKDQYLTGFGNDINFIMLAGTDAFANDFPPVA